MSFYCNSFVHLLAALRDFVVDRIVHFVCFCGQTQVRTRFNCRCNSTGLYIAHFALYSLTAKSQTQKKYECRKCMMSSQPTIVCERAYVLCVGSTLRVSLIVFQWKSIFLLHSFLLSFFACRFPPKNPAWLYTQQRQREREASSSPREEKNHSAHDSKPREKREREKLSILSQILFVICFFVCFMFW